MKINTSYGTSLPLGQNISAQSDGGELFQSVLDKSKASKAAKANVGSDPAAPKSKEKDPATTEAERLAALKDLLSYAKQTPVQRMREAILKKMGLTEESLKTLPPEKQAAIEAAIAEKIKEWMQGPQDGSQRQAQTPIQTQGGLHPSSAT